jgi:hypothetical protein
VISQPKDTSYLTTKDIVELTKKILMTSKPKDTGELKTKRY